MPALPITQDNSFDNQNIAYAVIAIAVEAAECICDVFETETEAINYLEYKENKNNLYTYKLIKVFIKA